jgi:pimeloyl-ACP methyl ester carboxylesterase
MSAATSTPTITRTLPRAPTFVAEQKLSVVPAVVPTLHVHRAGAGEPLVLLHGLGESHIGWRPVIDALAEDYDASPSTCPVSVAPPPCPAPCHRPPSTWPPR